MTDCEYTGEPLREGGPEGGRESWWLFAQRRPDGKATCRMCNGIVEAPGDVIEPHPERHTIPEAELEHGVAYAIRSRNLAVGVWDAGRQGFVGIREKFTSLYLFMEYGWESGGSYGTANAERRIGPCPIADLAEYAPKRPATADDPGVAEGWLTVGEVWRPKNQALFDWLNAVELTEGYSPRE